MIFSPADKLNYYFGGNYERWLTAANDLLEQRFNQATTETEVMTFNRFVAKYFSDLQPKDAIFVINLIESYIEESLGDPNLYSSFLRRNQPLNIELRNALIDSATVPESESFNILGAFKMIDSTGNMIDYNKGDVVYYDGKSYVASEDVSGWVPESKHPENKWKPIDLPDENIDGSEF